jgi:signal transduction histidine kinase
MDSKDITPRVKDLAIYLVKIAALSIIYHLAVRLGLSMAYVQANTSPVWPPTGIALAALLFFGLNLWPGISIGVFLGSIITGAPLNLALGMTFGNTMEALVGAYVLKRFLGFHNEIDRIQDVMGLAGVSIFSTTISASVGASTLMLIGFEEWANFGGIWFTWWIGDLLGALVVAPVILVWLTSTSDLPKKQSYVEGGIIFSLLSLVTIYVFSNQPPEGVFHQAMIYVIFPFLIWAALRLEQRGATFAMVLVSGIAIWGTTQELGPFSMGSRNDSLILLQTFMGVLSLTSLVLAAASIERRKATEALNQRVTDLATLNDASRTFLDNFDEGAIYWTICELAVTKLGLDVAWIESVGLEFISDSPVSVYGIQLNSLEGIRDFWEGKGDQEVFDQLSIKTIENVTLSSNSNLFLSYASCPLLFSGRVIGTIKFLSKEQEFFKEDRAQLIQSYANLAAVAIQNTRLFEQIQRSNKQLHALSQRLLKTQEEERLHLSRELHDESGQLLSALSVQLGLLERDMNFPEIANQRISELKQTANEIQENLHQLAVDLRPASLDHLGLVDTLRQFIEEFSRQYELKIEFEAVGMDESRLPIEVETALFRIVQESLTNVALHAQASQVDVLISRNNNKVVTLVEDDGIGFILTMPTIEQHLGLFGMMERIEMLGGEFTVESSSGKGTTVRAEVPCDD